MDVQTEIDAQKELIAQSQKIIDWLTARKEQLEALPNGSVYLRESIDFDRLTHDDVVKVLKALGGKWDKEVNSAESSRVDYSTKIDGLKVRLWAGEPPPNCKIVEVQEEIPAVPATTRTVRRLVCK